MTKYAFPFAAYGENDVLVPIDAAIVPFVSGALEKYLTRYVWQTDEDYEAGYNAIAKVMAAMSGNTLAELIRVQTATYRLLDNAINGTQYSETAGVVSPDVPDVPSGGETTPDAIRANVRRLWQLGENAATSQPFEVPAITGMPELDAAGGWSARLARVQGTKDATWFGGGTPVTLADLYTKQGVVSETDEGLISDAFEEVLGSVQDTTGIGQALAGLFGSAVGVASDGGVLVALLGAALASAATAATTAAGLQATVEELRALNRRLTGSDSNSDPALPSELPTIADRLQTVATNTATVVNVSANTATIAGRLLAGGESAAEWARRTSLLTSQTAPLAEGNDLYSTLISINDWSRRSAECCEENGGGEPEPDPAPGPTAGLCNSEFGEEFTPPNAVSEYAAGNYSSAGVPVDGLELITGSGSLLQNVLAPWLVGRSAFRVVNDVPVLVCLQMTLAPGDTGQYGVSIAPTKADGSPAFTPGGFGQYFPPSTGYTSTLAPLDADEDIVYYFITVNRLDGPNGQPEAYTGPPPRIFLLEGDAS